MTQIETPNILASFMQGAQQGSEMRRKKTLADYLQPALSGDKTALGQLFSVDPDVGYKVSNLASQQNTAAQEAQRDQLKQAASLWKSAPPQLRPDLYSKIRTLTANLGLATEDKLPVALNTPELEQGFGQFIDSIAGTEPVKGSVVGSALVNPFTGQEMYRAPERQDYQLSPDGTQWLPKPPSYLSSPATAPGEMNLPPISGIDMSRVQSALASLGQRFGAQMTSGLRSPEHNSAVGGKPNSQHLRGTAGDYVVPASQKAAFIAAAGRDGFEALDEGDHVHVELPPNRASNRPGLGAIPIPGAKPRTSERDAPSGYRFKRDGTLEPIPGGPADRNGNPTPGDLAQAEMGLRKEFSDQIKTPKIILTAFNQIDQAAKNPSAQNDLALIFSYMRMLDPGSVVREGEFANAQNAAGVPDQVRNAYNRAISGQRLNPEQRTGFVNSARGLRDQAQASIDGLREQYGDLATQYGYSAERVVGSSMGAGRGPSSAEVAPTLPAGFSWED